ncbi:KilA-N domain-containing protein [Pseudomonas vanderleydeniana]|uniref:KilA-N domain-containing protein n=1 Tax=Pseudomonas vanderleydeniana TaxID=2745495 RepID=A0A9E6TRR9_9PSED|nr:KilA-N domain-containing protein [Pseudomonas vanderleydeniana]QXI27450.1 hypothetical protein HU752_026675 [Pseudomonas vanderleydeniana]
MNIDIKHKHAGHIIVIEGHAFKADDRGQWNLTDIWRTLRLPNGKAPAQWRTKQAKRMEAMQNLHSSNGTGSRATKRAAIAYAAWVSSEFEDMVFDAFEAILEIPEVALAVANKMASLGKDHSAGIVKRMSFNDKCDWKAVKRGPQNQSAAAKAYRRQQAEWERLASQARRNIARTGM